MSVDYSVLQAAPLRMDPFTFLVARHFVPPTDLAAVIDGLPKLRTGGSFPVDALPLGDKARDLMQDLQGPVLRRIVSERFDLDLAQAPTMITLRGQSREKDGRIHRDSDAKRVTLLLYLNPPLAPWLRQQGCLRLLRGPDDIEDYVEEVLPVDGTLLVFPNGPATWHGHRPFVGPRYVVQVNYMADDAAARSELRRHRMSAWVKRLRAA